MRRLLYFITAVLFAVAAQAFADEGNAAAGKEVYQTKCLVCHGVNGASVIPANPVLSGQHADYLRAQIAAYRDGQRAHAVMSGMASGLTDAEITDIAAYLSQQQPVIAGAADMEAAAIGERLYRGGSLERNLPACAACHGPVGEGIAALAPLLSGQHADYTVAALKAYISKERNNAQMNSIAAKLTEEEINNLAEFISGLSY